MTCIKEHNNIMANNFQRHFQHLLPIITDLDVANAADLADQDLFTFDGTPLIQQLGPLIPLPVPVPPAPDQARPTSPSPPPLTDIAFSLGRKGGRQASYNGFMYSKDKTHNSSTTSWQCKDRKLYTPPCEGRLNTLDN